MSIAKPIGVFSALLLGAALSVLVASQTVPPAAHIKVTRVVGNGFIFHITPNFVVNSVYRIEINGPDGMIAERRHPASGPQVVVVESGLESGMSVTVEYDLQFDRIFAPSISTSETVLVLP